MAATSGEPLPRFFFFVRYDPQKPPRYCSTCQVKAVAVWYLVDPPERFKGYSCHVHSPIDLSSGLAGVTDRRR